MDFYHQEGVTVIIYLTPQLAVTTISSIDTMIISTTQQRTWQQDQIVFTNILIISAVVRSSLTVLLRQHPISQEDLDHQAVLLLL
jgi:hypothetical protein